jgi:DNA-binding transcriptional ArsR family regulator
MDIYSALADPNRRNIIELLASKGKLSATDISDKFKITPPAISQHLKVLREAKLVTMEKRAQQRIYQINTLKIKEIEKWIKKLTEASDARFTMLDRLLEREKLKKGGGRS